ncbi:MAG: hypothetical protein JO021_10735 [Alphaproteobacteria bacterium]|nr:hypothetical protein [Alphaproteobacteria bacterium]
MDTTTRDAIVIGYDVLAAARAKRLRVQAGSPVLLCQWRQLDDGRLACAWQREVDAAA